MLCYVYTLVDAKVSKVDRYGLKHVMVVLFCAVIRKASRPDYGFVLKFSPNGLSVCYKSESL